MNGGGGEPSSLITLAGGFEGLGEVGEGVGVAGEGGGTGGAVILVLQDQSRIEHEVGLLANALGGSDSLLTCLENGIVLSANDTASFKERFVCAAAVAAVRVNSCKSRTARFDPSSRYTKVMRIPI